MNDEVHRTLGNLEAKVDILLERSSKSEEEREKDRDRITQLEHDKTATKAVAAAISAGIAILRTVVDKFFPTS